MDKLKSSVLAFTFYVTDIDNLAKRGLPGVIFYGNLRKDSDLAYKELNERLKE